MAMWDLAHVTISVDSDVTVSRELSQNEVTTSAAHVCMVQRHALLQSIVTRCMCFNQLI